MENTFNRASEELKQDAGCTIHMINETNYLLKYSSFFNCEYLRESAF